ncbi:probable RNA-binding protein EIF1AD [Acipenser ruthenus]|uniref:probable RNA-binding protein EIF1AD n=1 Tax=Acipenser ruthenus TaxID=7906 RepID=UPI0027426767|nr:probable RNA-binding protein EIF1AD [Acipenser ruthenus]XP_058876053.1 probable RNA-binding protein EIF1AD [Acipenser ruthenus]
MSQATKRKHVVKEVLGDYVIPTERQQIVRVLGTPGNNLHEVETERRERFLVTMPTKFRKNIWIKRGDFLIVDPIEEGEKVKAEIRFILHKDYIRYLKKEGAWPEQFCAVAAESDCGSKNGHSEVEKADGCLEEEGAGSEEKGAGSEEEGAGSEDSESEPDDSDLFVNTNRVDYEYTYSEEEEEEDEEEEGSADRKD